MTAPSPRSDHALYGVITPRLCLHAIALTCLLAVGVALVSQYMFDMPPCAWCVFQRLVYLLIAFVCWLGLLISRRYAPRQTTPRPTLIERMTCLLAMLLAVGGAVAAWYQHTVAANLFSCTQTFADRFMVASGLDAALPWLFGIYATCMDARVQVLGLEYALWSLTLFVMLAMTAVQGALAALKAHA